MLGTILHGPRDVRCEEVPEPKILHPTDAIIRLSASCICGSDLWPFRGLEDVTSPMAMGHEYCGVVEEVGGAVTTVRPGQFVVQKRRRSRLFLAIVKVHNADEIMAKIVAKRLVEHLEARRLRCHEAARDRRRG